MANEIERLNSLYCQLDSLVGSGEDVVADVRKEINNLELTYMRNVVFPKIANILGAELKRIRCDVDCNFQFTDNTISYSFCTPDSPLIKNSIVLDEHDVHQQDIESKYDDADMKRLHSSLKNLVEIAATLSENAETALNFFPIKIKDNTKNKSTVKEPMPTLQFHKHEVECGEILLYTRSKGCNAIGKLLPNREVVVLKGSTIRSDVQPSYRYRKMRDDIITHYCRLTDNGYIVERNLPPMTVSGSSALCQGRPSNGYDDWKDENGTRLGDIVER